MTDLVDAVLAGVVAALVWGTIAWVVRLGERRRNFGYLSGVYSVARKVTNKRMPFSVELRRKRWIGTNTVRLTYRYNAGERQDLVSGQIAMSDEVPMSGEGVYTHLAAGAELWGNWKVTTNKDRRTILVDHTYTGDYKIDHTGRRFDEVVQGYVWTQTEHFDDLITRIWDRVQRLGNKATSLPKLLRLPWKRRQ